MFHFPAYTPTQAMNSPAGNTTQLVLGFPIRTSSDQRFVGNSPRHNAASHVLHRLSMPRHPPYALKKHTQNTKETHHTRTHTPTPPKNSSNRHTRACINARVHSPVLTHHTHTQPPTQHEQPHAGHTEHTQTTLCQRPRHPTACQPNKTVFGRASTSTKRGHHFTRRCISTRIFLKTAAVAHTATSTTTHNHQQTQAVMHKQ